jgi:flavin-binding protein dodecin
MPDSLYKVIELIGSSDTSWEQATKNALEEASKHLTDLRVAEVDDLDVHMVDGKWIFRAKVHVSFRYKGE